MKIINLVNLENSDIKYQINKFPDGQQNIVLDIPFDKCVQIKSRLNNWLDLELIVCTVASLRELGVEEIHLYVPYIVGARSDRKFEEGGNNYLKDVICPVINSLNFKSVTCIDPHSDVLEACIKGFKKESNKRLVEYALYNIYSHGIINIMKDYILVSPDGGSLKKIYKLAEQIGYKGDIITCSKDRDKDGKLTKFKIDLSLIKEDNKDYIIIDDICDGGATFIKIASMLKLATTGKIYLIVTHGIFSEGTTELGHYFDRIYCTNSYKNCNQLELMKVKQLDIFSTFHNEV